MESEYLISETDYVKAMALSRKLTPKLITFYVIIVLLLVLVAIFSLSPGIIAGAIGGLIGGSIAVLGLYIVSSILARRHYRKYKAIQESIYIRLEEDGIHFRNSDGEGKVKWNKVFKWRENNHYILVYPMPRLYHIIPKRIVNKGFDISGLRNKLEAEVGKST